MYIEEKKKINKAGVAKETEGESKKEGEVYIELNQRNKRKFTTIIYGLDLFGEPQNNIHRHSVLMQILTCRYTHRHQIEGRQ